MKKLVLPEEIQALIAAANKFYRKPFYRLYKHELPECGAKTRSGRPCRMKAAWDEHRITFKNGRCLVHGGASSGPRTEAGRLRCSAAAKAMWARRRKVQEAARQGQP
jgi:hypothetical protein